MRQVIVIDSEDVATISSYLKDIWKYEKVLRTNWHEVARILELDAPVSQIQEQQEARLVLLEELCSYFESKGGYKEENAIIDYAKAQQCLQVLKEYRSDMLELEDIDQTELLHRQSLNRNIETLENALPQPQ